MLPNIIDGFTLNSALLYLPKRFFPNALAQLDPLRRANNYRPRWIVLPEDPLDPAQLIGGYATNQYQVQVVPGSYLWGVNFTVTNGLLGDLFIQIVDSCTEIPLGSDFQSGTSLRPSGASQLWPRILAQPRLILEPGLINVEIANGQSGSRTCQLVMHFAEPCYEIWEQTGMPACAR